MIMIYQPGGFDTYLSELTKMPEANRADPVKMRAFNTRYDFIHLGPVPKRR